MSEEKSKSEIAQREEKVLKFWQDNKIFEKSLEKKAPNGNFVFYDGPPFATGEPHYGHVLAGTIKDVIPRYKTMQGYYVRRIWGWDCHGLPIENMIEKELGLSTKKDIEEYGVEKFNKVARESVLRYEELWKNFIPRVGRWIDMDHSYKTMDAAYTESVWWSFKNLYDKKFIYEGFKVMPFCPRCGTSLSNFEVNQGYKDINDISVYVKFKVKNIKKDENVYLLAWTTTPWTLPGNVALAVGKNIKYLWLKKDNEILIVAEERKEIVGEGYEEVGSFFGEDMPLEYEPLFDYYSKDESLKNRENGWKVYAGDFVTTEEGTGIVHMAPAFGADDYELSKKENLPFIQHVDMEGKMKSEVKDFAGLFVKPKSNDEKERLATDIEVIKYLQAHGSFFDKKKITHSYPHCWRCDTPLLNYATSSWFVKVTDLKEKMSDLNEKVKWVPAEIGENRFGKWLEGARDWAISRSRYWGAPIPVWSNEEKDVFVIGSVNELKEKTKKSGNKYFLMRHGEATNNTEEVHYSDTSNDANASLTEKGRIQTKDSISKFQEHVDIIISSPFLRSKQTAEIVCEQIGFPIEKVIYDSRIQEWKTSTKFDAKSKEEFRAYYNQDYIKDLQDNLSDGESFAQVIKRVGEFIYEIESKYQGQTIFIVAHSGVIRALNFIADGLTFEKAQNEGEPLPIPDNATIRKIVFIPIPHNENYELDLHRPYIDQISLIDEKGNKLNRVKEVFDTWYDSGSMPYAQIHYPFENKKEFEEKGSLLFPADFIAEGLDQTRGWFYTLLVLGTGLFEKSPYKNVIVNGIVLAEDGQKMSKRLKNYPDPMHIINKYGADTLRYYMLSSPVVRSEDLAFSERGLDEISKKVILKLDNILSFYLMYSEENKTEKKESKNILDLWIICRLNQTGGEITKSLDNYRLDSASRPILDFIDDFSTWYIRRSRERFKSDDLEDKKEALGTTLFVLKELSKYMAPFTPFFAEDMFRQIRSESDPESVHLCEWPHFAKALRGDDDVIKNMKEVRRIVSLALEKRMVAGIKVRQPLSKLKVKNEKLKDEGEYLDLIKDELNVKEVEFVDNLEGEVELDTEITEELKKEGNVREFIRAVQDLRKDGNLAPSDSIKLKVETNGSGKEFLNSVLEQIKKPTNVSEMSFEPNDGKEVEIDGIKYKIKLE